MRKTSMTRTTCFFLFIISSYQLSEKLWTTFILPLMESLDIFNLNIKTSTRVITNVFIEALEEKSLKSGCVLFCYRVRKSPL